MDGEMEKKFDLYVGIKEIAKILGITQHGLHKILKVNGIKPEFTGKSLKLRQKSANKS
jgi:phage antirepressor YoqD-like protein